MSTRAEEPTAETLEQFDDVSPEAATSVGRKIAAIRRAEGDSGRNEPETLIASEIELESFVLYSMADEIPAKVETIDIAIGNDLISAAIELTFETEEGSGNPIWLM